LEVRLPTRRITKAAKATLAGLALLIGVSTAWYTLEYLVLPSVQELRYTLNAIRNAEKKVGKTREIVAYLKIPDPDDTATPWEYGWRNVHSSSYTWYMIRLALLELGFDERVKTVVYTAWPSGPIQTQVYDLDQWGLPKSTADAAHPDVVIDYRAMHLGWPYGKYRPAVR